MESLVSHRIENSSSLMPITATLAGLHEFTKLRLFSSIGNGSGAFTSTMDAGKSSKQQQQQGQKQQQATTTKAAAAAVRYRECHRNHAVNSGGHAVDGCGEFMPSGEEGTVEALKCAACNCHRNFHRKEVEGETTCEVCRNVIRRPDPIAAGTSTGAQAQAAAAGGSGGSQQLLALPSPAQIISRVTQSAPYHLLPSGPADSGSPSTIKKRFRSKFTTEQKEKMAAFAEKLGWKIQKHDEGAVQEFCAEIGVKRHVLKVWMHNNKHTIGKKGPPT